MRTWNILKQDEFIMASILLEQWDHCSWWLVAALKQMNVLMKTRELILDILSRTRDKFVDIVLSYFFNRDDRWHLHRNLDGTP